MKKLSLFAAVAAMLMGFASCEKVEPTALETTDLTYSKLAGHVYYTKLDDNGATDAVKLYESKGTVTIEVTEKGADDKATGNVVIVTADLKGGKFEANIPVAVGKKADCKATCIFVQENYDLKTTADDADFKLTPITYKGEAKASVAYGETVYVELFGAKVGSLEDGYHFLN